MSVFPIGAFAAAEYEPGNVDVVATSDGTFSLPLPPPTTPWGHTHGGWANTNTPGLTTAMLRGATRIEVAMPVPVTGGINMYFGPGGSLDGNHHPAFTWNASAGVYVLDLTQQNMAAFTGNAWAILIGHVNWTISFANLGVTNITLFYGAEIVRTIGVGEQIGTLRAGIPGTVTFPVETQGIDNGSYTVAVTNTPVGVSIPGQLQITDGAGVLTLAGNRHTLAGTRDTLILTIGYTHSTAFTLTIDPGPNYGDVNDDGIVNDDDLVLLRQFIAARDQEAFLAKNPGFNLENADVNGDGVINAADSTLLRRHLLDRSVSLGPPPPEPRYLIALTFDDGPNLGAANGTVGVLDALERHGAVGTFFVNGNNINAQTIPVLQRMIDGGHTIENHTYTHRNFNTGIVAPGGVGSAGSPMSWDAMVDEIVRTNAAIYNAVGVTPSFFRPTFFAVGAHVNGLDTYVGLPFVFAGIDTNDWDAANDAQAIANVVLNAARFGTGGVPAIDNNGADGAIVLQHDGPTSNQVVRTIAALDIFIPQMQEMGYAFVTLCELFELRGATPEVFNHGSAWPNTWVRSTGDAPVVEPYEEITISLQADSSSAYGPGDTVVVEVYIDNPDERSIGSISYLDIKFDADVLEPYSIAHGSVSTAQHLTLIKPDSVGDSLRFSFDSETDFTSGGVLLTLSFVVANNAPTGSTDIGIALAGMSTFLDIELAEDADYVLVPTSITIEGEILPPVEFTGTNPNHLLTQLQTRDAVLNTRGNLGIFAQHGSFIIPAGSTLTVETALNIHRGAHLIVEGTLVISANGRLNNQGVGSNITIAPGGELIVNGRVENVTGSTFINTGEITINDTGRLDIRAGTFFCLEYGTVEGTPNINRDAIRLSSQINGEE